MASTNPFLENDFTKLFSEFKVPGFDMQALVATQRRNIEAVSHANQLAIEGVQAVMRRQGEILRQMVEESTNSLKDLMAAGAPEAKVAHQTELKTSLQRTK